jgi:hypothetical protein
MQTAMPGRAVRLCNGHGSSDTGGGPRNAEGFVGTGRFRDAGRPESSGGFQGWRSWPGWIPRRRPGHSRAGAGLTTIGHANARQATIRETAVRETSIRETCGRASIGQANASRAAIGEPRWHTGIG